MLEALSDIKAHYRSGKDNLSRDFFRPCMSVARRYRRAVGYFSTSALLSWADALPRAATDGDFHAQLIASPELSAGDLATLRSAEDPEKRAEYRARMTDQVLQQIAELLENPSDLSLRAEVFAWLIANERLEIKFAFPDHVGAPGIFHEKIGIFEFADGAQIAFTGSANETYGGHQANYESIDVYRSWKRGEDGRVHVKIEQFEEAWNGMAEGLSVLSPSNEVLARIKARSPKKPPEAALTDPCTTIDPKWRHQEEAIEAVLAAKAGVLEMATGTGKTRTAIKLLSELIARSDIDSAIVTTDGTDLLDQWGIELGTWNLSEGPKWLIYRHYEKHHELGEFALDPSHSIMLISRSQLRKLLDRLPAAQKQKMLIVHDEVHGLGTPSLVDALAGRHSAFGWRLGLSATPDRAYDQVGNDFITSEIGPTLFSFPLEAAIARGVLSEFDYIPLEYDLTEGDRERLQAVYSKKAARLREGNPMSEEEVWTEIAKVYKTAEMKPAVFADFLANDPSALSRSIIFVETKEYGNKVIEVIENYTHLYRTYYAEDDRDYLLAFANGEINCLITCHRVSQGIDIRSLNSVILFSSARAKLETIQRIGRCLRADPDRPTKRACVIDFVRPSVPTDVTPNADQERCEWLSRLAKVRKGDGYGA